MDPSSRRGDDLERALARLAFVEIETPDDFVDRVLAALEEDDADRLTVLVQAARRLPASTWRAAGRSAGDAVSWLAQRDRLRWGAVASSAVILGAVAIGLEARHLSRTRGERAA